MRVKIAKFLERSKTGDSCIGRQKAESNLFYLLADISLLARHLVGGLFGCAL